MSGKLDFTDSEDSQLVADAKKNIPDPCVYTYSEKEIILYNLGIGATEEEIDWVYEGADEFAPLPTFGLIVQFEATGGLPLDFLPNYNPAKLLHAEQYFAIKGPVPPSATMVTESYMSEVLDKQKAAAVTGHFITKDKATGEVVFEGQSTVFIRGAGGFGGRRNGKDRGPASAANVPPKRAPDVTSEEKTSPTQAALYRLSGDINPLHISADFAAIGGFDKPILHGLCSMGIAGKHILKNFGAFKDIKVRFAGVLYPGETLVIEQWKEGKTVIFSAKCKERDAVVLSAAAATLADEDSSAKL